MEALLADLKKLPEPYRSMALRNHELFPQKAFTQKHYIYQRRYAPAYAFRSSLEGDRFWREVQHRIYEEREPLPRITKKKSWKR